MSELYTRRGSLSLIKEAAINTPLTPTTFIPFNDENIVTEFPYIPVVPVSGNRAMNLRTVAGAIPAPIGTINLNIEPKTFPHFLLGILGGLTSGQYMPITGESGAFTVGSTVSGVSSSKSATVVADINGEFLLVSGATGDFTDGEALQESAGGTQTATLTEFDATVFAHIGSLPAEIGTGETFSLQVNYAESAIRYFGVRFTGLDAIGQADNVLTAGVGVMAQGMFRQAKVTAITAGGAGAKTISLDQSLGLVAADSIKLYRPGTGFLDFSASSTKTHTVATVASAKSITVTNLETATAVGDLILLAPQTASYTLANEFAWIGGSEVTIGADIDNLASEKVEDFTISILNEYESRHSAQGADFQDRFPSAILQKGCTGAGSFKMHYTDEDFVKILRLNTAQGLELRVIGCQIGSTGIEYEVRVYLPEVQLDNFDTSLSVDALVDQDIPFTHFYNSSQGYQSRVVVINDIASY